ncbi:MAG: ParB/RepB/Spo0J family partition protein [Cyanobacteria bacterium]|jgi:ParB family chromosome partitioning protein|nr:ParB/RepB/Spo0J family partition protein [Cyanobacteria bacterium GSL.Bin21]
MAKKSEKAFNSNLVDSFLGLEEEKSEETLIPIKEIKLPNNQPRKYFDDESIQQLAQSIQTHGIIQNLLVRPLDQAYELIAGERRYRAAQSIGLKEVPVRILQITKEEAASIALIENLHREDLNPVEETEGIIELLAKKLKYDRAEIPKLLERHYQEKSSHSAMRTKELAQINEVFNEIVGRMTWRSFTKNRLPILKLPEDIFTQIKNGKISYTKATTIARLKDEEKRKRMLERAIEENLSLKQVIEEVKAIKEGEEGKQKKSPTTAINNSLNKVKKMLDKKKPWETHPEKWQSINQKLKELEKELENL